VERGVKGGTASNIEKWSSLMETPIFRTQNRQFVAMKKRTVVRTCRRLNIAGEI
jgi:hypothetical protein